MVMVFTRFKVTLQFFSLLALFRRQQQVNLICAGRMDFRNCSHGVCAFLCQRFYFCRIVLAGEREGMQFCASVSGFLGFLSQHGSLVMQDLESLIMLGLGKLEML